jgi:hypothetical protein
MSFHAMQREIRDLIHDLQYDKRAKEIRAHYPDGVTVEDREYLARVDGQVTALKLALAIVNSHMPMPVGGKHKATLTTDVSV